MRSYKIHIIAIITQLTIANVAALGFGFHGYPCVAICTYFCWQALRDLPSCIQLSRVLDAGEYCKRTQYTDEAVENFWRENSKLEEMNLK